MSDHRPVVLMRSLLDDASIDEATYARIEDEARHLGAQGMPWYLHACIFAGAFIAGVLITVGIFSLFDLELRGVQLTIFGLAYIAAGVCMHRFGRHVFFEHLGLACSIGGHAVALFGVADTATRESRSGAVLVAACILCLLLYGVYGSFLHRLISGVSVIAIAKYTLPDMHAADALHAVAAAAAAVCAWRLMRERQAETWRPLAYACAIGLLVVLLPISDRGLWFDDVELPHRVISSSAMGVALLTALHFASRHASVSGAQRLIAVLVVAVLVALGTPGIPAALFLIVLGHATQHPLISGLGLAGLPLFVWKYFYSLDQDLLVKSAVLGLSGLVLLIARFLMKRFTSR